ncbi:hypothetical protein J3R82DRAFT_11266 [Butyriboletus roseoflavus]|nr:hypothetical protein J3R82DRAFT_11266 [Butyriboletus roseoflavus]
MEQPGISSGAGPPSSWYKSVTLRKGHGLTTVTPTRSSFITNPAMSSSHHPTEAIAINAATPPTGWTNQEAYMYRSYYWAGTSGDIKDMLSTEYRLKNAQPLWTHLPKYGNVLFIFQAEPSTGKTSYYVWNGIESSVCFIDALGIDEIRESINKFGEGKDSEIAGILDKNKTRISAVSSPKHSPLSSRYWIGHSSMSLADPTDHLAVLSDETPSSAANHSEGEDASLAPPRGWTNDPAHMYLDYYWRGRDEDLKESLETDYKMPDAQPLLTRDPKFGDVKFLLQSRHGEDSEAKYYVWNDIESELCLIKSPTNLREIYKTIHENEGYLQGLKLEVVEADEEEE